jgi:hypothetical protein
MWPKFRRLLFYLISALYIAVAITGLLIWRDSVWREPLSRFLGRTWLVFVAQDVGSTGRGFINATAVTVLCILAAIVSTAFVHGLEAMWKHIAESAAIALVSLPVAILLVYGTQFIYRAAHVGYENHQSLAQANGNLKAENRALATDLEARKHGISTSDPVFGNIIYLLQAFSVFRNALHGQPCVVRVTAPPQSLALASTIAQFQIATSNCFTFGPDPNIRMNPDLDKEATEGMVNDAIVFHADRDDTAANELFMRLSNQITLQRSYEPDPLHSYQLPNGLSDVHTVWLQFGPDVKWNSERYPVGRR